MESERLNYGMAISPQGEFQIIDTVHSQVSEMTTPSYSPAPSPISSSLITS